MKTETTMSKRETAGVAVVNAINSCLTTAQIAVCERMVQNFFALYDPRQEVPLMRFLYQRSFEIVNGAVGSYQ